MIGTWHVVGNHPYKGLVHALAAKVSGVQNKTNCHMNTRVYI